MNERQRRAVLRLVDLLDKVDFVHLTDPAVLLLGVCAQDVRQACGLDRDIDALIAERRLHVGVTKEDFMRIVGEIEKEGHQH